MCIKKTLEGLTICIQLFETDIYKGQFLTEFLSSCAYLPSSHFFIPKLISTKMQERIEDFWIIHCLLGSWKQVSFSVQDIKQECSLTPIRARCRKPLCSSQQGGKPGSLHIIGQKNKCTQKPNFHNSFCFTIQTASFFPQQTMLYLQTATYAYCTQMKKQYQKFDLPL